jgi:hypothetical protein
MERIRKYLELARELRGRAEGSADSSLASQQLTLADYLEQRAQEEAVVAADGAPVASWLLFSTRRART